ncbi:MAG TPA: fumarate hydratase, partial [Acetobacteraceae bacterium]|nr:fumarate hydratase [Acetobacteraceae bacterium]
MNEIAKRPLNFAYAPMFPLGSDATTWRRLDIGGVSTIEADGKTILKISADTLSALAFEAFKDISHLLRPAHLAKLRRILDDPE